MEKIIVLIYNLMEKIIFYLKFLFLFVCPGDKGFCEKVKLKIILFFEIRIYILLSGKIFLSIKFTMSIL